MRRRQTNRYRNGLGLSAITAIRIVVASLALVGLGIVVSKNRGRASGEEQRKVESEMRLLNTEILALNKVVALDDEPRSFQAAALEAAAGRAPMIVSGVSGEGVTAVLRAALGEVRRARAPTSEAEDAARGWQP